MPLAATPCRRSDRGAGAHVVADGEHARGGEHRHQAVPLEVDAALLVGAEIAEQREGAGRAGARSRSAGSGSRARRGRGRRRGPRSASPRDAVPCTGTAVEEDVDVEQVLRAAGAAPSRRWWRASRRRSCATPGSWPSRRPCTGARRRRRGSRSCAWRAPRNSGPRARPRRLARRRWRCPGRRRAGSRRGRPSPAPAPRRRRAAAPGPRSAMRACASSAARRVMPQISELTTAEIVRGSTSSSIRLRAISGSLAQADGQRRRRWRRCRSRRPA